MNREELICLDIEVLPNYMLVCIKRLSDNKQVTYSAFNTALSADDRKKLNNILTKYTSFGYNSINYDMPLLSLMIDGASTSMIHKVSKAIVEEGLPSYRTYSLYDIPQRAYKHFDIQEPSPAVMISLKNYGTRVGSKKLQEFYLDPHTPIKPEQVEGLLSYCWNDVNVTIDLFYAIEGRLDLRESMSKQYGLDLMSKSDAQIAEAVIDSELRKCGIKAMKPTLPANYRARYTAPSYIHFERQDLNELITEIENIDFEVAKNGSLVMPKNLANRKIKIGNTVYKMGIGGLHSQEKKLSIVSDDKNVMRNADFTSYYPFIILNLGLYPKHLGKGFLNIYRDIVEDRIASKAKIPKIKAEIKRLKDLL